MASILKHLRSSTANKRPTASGLADGQIAINTASGTPALFFKDSASNIVKVGPAHVGATAPNTSPAGSAGNSTGELWVDNGLTTNGLKYYNGTAFVNLTPSGTTSTIGLVELATDAETQAGTDAARAVTPSGLQSKISNSTSTSSSTTIASSTAVKSAYDLADAALPKTGGTITGAVTISPSGSLVFEGATDDGFETTIAVVDPTADRTITLPNVTGTVVTTGDSGTVTSTMIANDTIVDADINSAAAITLTKLGTGALPTTITVASGNIVDGTISNVEISASAAIADTKLDTISTADKVSLSALNIDGGTDIGAALADADLFIVDDGGAGTNRKAAATRITDYTFGKVSGDITITSSGVAAIGSGKITSTMILDGTILNADVNASAAIAGTKISPDFGSQTIATTGIVSHALGTAGAPTVTFTGDTNTGIYSPGADQVAISTNGTGRLFVNASGNVGVGTTSPSFLLTCATSADGVDGVSVESPSLNGVIRLRADGTNGNAIRVGGVGAQGNTLRFLVGSDVERMRIDSSGRLGLGTTSPDANSQLHVVGSSYQPLYINTTGTGGGGAAFLRSGTQALYVGTAGGSWLTGSSTADGLIRSEANLIFGIGNSERMRIDSSGRVGIGTTAPATTLEVNGTSYVTDLLIRNNAGTPSLGTSPWLYSPASGALAIATNASERVRIDSSGRLLVGTSSASSAGAYAQFGLIKIQGNTSSSGGSAILNIARGETATSITSGEDLGAISFTDSSGNEFGTIVCAADGTAGSNDYPGRLVFSTTADGASSPTERMRITSAGNAYIGRIADGDGQGISLHADGFVRINRSSAVPLVVNRNGDDGTLVELRQADVVEGTISVSGTTVQLNGAHLSRWSQLLNGGREDILRGTVLSNLDEMCEWGDQDNEQLNRMKVSDVEGDPNVSGVFVDWDNDDDTYTEDFYCAMTGDFIIRIAEGVTVQRGDLLMSAGDGTAKPQDDDIVRSKTIAKVTSTHVTCTYEDGSYCVPCVLMAC
jgi:hypothetical protein